MGDLEHVHGRQAALEEPGVDVVLRVARQEEPGPARVTEQDDRLVVDRAPVVGRVDRHRLRRPQHLEPDLVEPQPGTLREPPARRPVGEGLVPRGPARTRPVHPVLEHPPDLVPLQHADEARHVVLVRVGQHHDVDAAVPRRDPRVELHEEPLGVRPAVDEHPRAPRGLDEDRVALADVEDAQARDPRGGRDDGHGAEDEGDAHHRAGGGPGARSRRASCDVPTPWWRAAPASPPPGTRPAAKQPRHRPGGQECGGGGEAGRDRELRGQGDGGTGKRRRGAHDEHHEVEEQPRRQPGRPGDHRRRAGRREGAPGEREDAGRHRGRDERHHGEVHGGRDERQAAERGEHVGERRRLRRERDAQALGEPARQPAASEAPEPSGEGVRPREQARGRERPTGGSRRPRRAGGPRTGAGPPPSRAPTGPRARRVRSRGRRGRPPPWRPPGRPTARPPRPRRRPPPRGRSRRRRPGGTGRGAPPPPGPRRSRCSSPRSRRRGSRRRWRSRRRGRDRRARGARSGSRPRALPRVRAGRRRGRRRQGRAASEP